MMQKERRLQWHQGNYQREKTIGAEQQQLRQVKLQSTKLGRSVHLWPVPVLSCLSTLNLPVQIRKSVGMKIMQRNLNEALLLAIRSWLRWSERYEDFLLYCTLLLKVCWQMTCLLTFS